MIIITQGRMRSRELGGFRILQKGARNTDRRSPVVGTGPSFPGKFVKLRSSEMGFQAI